MAHGGQDQPLFIQPFIRSERKPQNFHQRKLKRYLDKNDIEILDHTGEKYNPGAEFDDYRCRKGLKGPKTIIKETIKPTILLKGTVIRAGEVTIVSNESTRNNMGSKNGQPKYCNRRRPRHDELFIAVNINGKIEIIKKPGGVEYTPSVFGFDKSCNKVVGQKAYDRLYKFYSKDNAENFRAEIKRVMGTPETVYLKGQRRR